MYIMFWVNCVQDDIIKIRIAKDGNYSINDYGIYDYFQYSKEVYPSKLVATVIDGYYLVCMDKEDNCFHHNLADSISSIFGDLELYIYACDDELVMWKDSKRLSEAEYNAILNIFYEIKRFTDEKNINIYLDISFIDYEKVSSSNNIDSIIDKFVDDKDVILNGYLNVL